MKAKNTVILQTNVIRLKKRDMNRFMLTNELSIRKPILTRFVQHEMVLSVPVPTFP